jgi:preprotein translocase subunit SecE
MSRFGNYLRDTKAELQHVSWPTQRQALVYTALVIIISGLTAVFVGVFDKVFTKALDVLIHSF